MTFGNPFGGVGADMDPALRQRILDMLAQQPTQDEVPAATPPGFSGFNPPDAPTNTMALRMGGALAADPTLQSLPLPLSMSAAAPRGMPVEPQGPLLNGTLDAPAAPPQAAPPALTGPANSVSQPDASAPAQLPTLLGLKPPAMPSPEAKPVASAPVPGADDEEAPAAGRTIGAPTTYTGLNIKPTAAPNAVPGAPSPGVSAPTVAGVPANGAPGSTTSQAAPSAPANTAPKVAEPSIWKKLGDAGIGDQMIAFGGGLLSGRDFRDGLGRAFGGVAAVSQSQAATDLAKGKVAAEQYKLQKEMQAQNQTAKIVAQRMGISIDDATALAANPQFVQNFLQSQYGAQDGRTRNADGSMAVIRGSKEDPDVIAQTKRAELEPIDYAASKAAAVTKATTENSGDTIETQNVPGIGMVAINKDKVLSEDPAERAAAYRVVAPGQAPRAMTTDEYARFSKGYFDASGTPHVPSPGVNINNQAESAEKSEIGKARGTIVSGAIGGGEAAARRISLLDEMSGALDRAGPNITTGPLGEHSLRFKQALGGILGKELPGTSATELFNNTGPVLAGEAAKAITSRPAMIEFTTMLNSKPGLANSIEGNRAMMDVMRQRAVIDKDLADIASRSPGTDDFLTKRDAYLEAHPMINPFTGQPFRSATDANRGGGSDTASTPPQGIMQLRSKSEYDAAPRGTQYIAPDGRLRVKQ